jgi:hypothetical protein
MAMKVRMTLMAFAGEKALSSKDENDGESEQ